MLARNGKKPSMVAALENELADEVGPWSHCQGQSSNGHCDAWCDGVASYCKENGV